jgi:hypothetical protein
MGANNELWYGVVAEELKQVQIAFDQARFLGGKGSLFAKNRKIKKSEFAQVLFIYPQTTLQT